MKKPILLGVLLMLLYTSFGQSMLNYSISQEPWDECLGNHRAVISIPSSGELAYLSFDWRRHDKDVNKRHFIIINAQTNDTVKNIYRLNVNNESCEIFFGPVTAGSYYFYYLPFQVQMEWGSYWGDYLPRKSEFNSEWLGKNNILNRVEVNYVKAECTHIQARQSRDSFYPMEVIALQKEKDSLIAENPDSRFLLFPEERKYPIRMLDNIPQKWILNPPASSFSDTAERNEYFTFQIGLWAIDQIENVALYFSPLKGKALTIPSSALTCFNTGGIDPSGKPFTIELNVAESKLQPLWVGIDIDQNVPAGKYVGSVTIETKNAGQKIIDIEINVTDSILVNRGDGEKWRHSRLRWLNSTAGLDDKNIAPFKPIKLNGNTIFLTNKDLVLNPYGMPTSINIFDEEILSAPIKFSIISDKEEMFFKAGKTDLVKQASGIIVTEIVQKNKALKLSTRSEIESDGWMKYTFELEAQKEINIDDINLIIPFRKEIAQYVMGMGLPGSKIPVKHESKWSGPHDSFWIGNTRGGLYCELRGAKYCGPLLNLYHPDPPISWDNHGEGGFEISTEAFKREAKVYSGKRIMKKGEKLQFECAFILTPVKKIDTEHQFNERYYQSFINEDIESFIPQGLSIINILPPDYALDKLETANNPPYNTSMLKEIHDYWHSQGVRIKSYYQTREIYDVPEIWAFRSLGTEILADGEGKGYPWLREHYVENYTPQWYHRRDSVSSLAAILTSGESRFFNYYIEGIKWIMSQTDCDGFYIDDSIFDRIILKRMRRVMYAIKPNSLIDLHSNTGFSKGPATQYTEYFPFIDKIWFGESFNYSQMPSANWLVEVSGIPFGLMGDMLQLGGNQWLGMVFGMTNRLGWITDGIYCDPTNIWEVWDKFGIADARMVGYWDQNPIVTTSNENVCATAYVKDKSIPASVPPGGGIKTNNNGMLVSLGNWANEAVSVKLTIDFSKINLDPKEIKIRAPFIKDFQEEQIFRLDEELTIDAKKGLILYFEEQ